MYGCVWSVWFMISIDFEYLQAFGGSLLSILPKALPSH